MLVHAHKKLLGSVEDVGNIRNWIIYPSALFTNIFLSIIFPSVFQSTASKHFAPDNVLIQNYKKKQKAIKKSL